MSKDLTTIITYTDNSMDETLRRFCARKLKKAAAGKRIIAISQKPIDDFAENIVVGEIGRSHLNLFKQMLLGVEQATTPYIALAEHDVLYTKEHFDWTPPSEVKFYYNINHWLVNYKDGVFSWYRRKVLSQMIANRELTLAAVKDKVTILSAGGEIRKGQAGACEFGVCDNREAYKNLVAAIEAAGSDLGKKIGEYRAAAFQTVAPNIDIRHGNNYSGGRRAKLHQDSLPYWGTFWKVMQS